MKKSIIIAPEDCRGVDWISKAADAGLDTLAFHTGGPRHDLYEALADVAAPEFREKCVRAGVSYEYEEHAAENILPSALSSTHPELFAVDAEGNRRTGDRAGWCTSAPGMAERIVEEAEKLAGFLAPPSHNYYFWGADSSSSVCRCPECSKYSRADLNVLNANLIAEGVRRFDPLANVSLLAYTEGTLEAPETVTPHEALFLEFAPFHRRFDTSIADTSNEVNARYRSRLEKLLEFFPAERVHILEYWLDVSLFSKWKYPVQKIRCSFEIMKRDLEFYCSLGIRNIGTFGVMMGKEYFDRFGDEELYAYGEALKQFY